MTTFREGKGVVVRHQDVEGRHFMVELPSNCTDPRLGHIIGPPVFDESVLDLDAEAILTRLHNELFIRGIVTGRDATTNPRAVTEAIRAATSPIIHLNSVITAYEDKEA